MESGAVHVPKVGDRHRDPEAAFKENLKNMGKASRKKFSQLARLFSRRKRKSFQHQLLRSGEISNPSRDNLVMHDDYNQLVDEGSDSDLEPLRSNTNRDRSKDRNGHESPAQRTHHKGSESKTLPTRHNYDLL